MSNKIFIQSLESSIKVLTTTKVMSSVKAETWLSLEWFLENFI